MMTMAEFMTWTDLSVTPYDADTKTARSTSETDTVRQATQADIDDFFTF